MADLSLVDLSEALPHFRGGRVFVQLPDEPKLFGAELVHGDVDPLAKAVFLRYLSSAGESNEGRFVVAEPVFAINEGNVLVVETATGGTILLIAPDYDPTDLDSVIKNAVQRFRTDRSF